MTQARDSFIEAQQRMLSRYGVEAESLFVSVPSIAGQAHILAGGNGPPVFIINGIGIPAAMWAPLLAELDGVQWYAVDMPSFGLTDTNKDFAKRLRQNAVQFIEDVLDALALQSTSIIANSLGSLWTSWLALDKPARVTSVTHIGCPAIVLDTSAPLQMRLLSNRFLGRLLTRIQPPSERQVEELAKIVNEHPLVPELANLILATERLPYFRDTFLSMLNALLTPRGSRPEMRLTADQLRQISQPTFIVWGDSDPFGTPEVGRKMVNLLPDASLHIVNAGHAPWLTRSEEIGPLVNDFLHRHSNY